MIAHRLLSLAFILVSLCLGGIVGCSGKAPKYTGSKSAILGGGGTWNVSVEERHADVSQKPWEHWSLSRTLQGHPIKDPTFIHGDELLRAGHYHKAFEALKKVDWKRLPLDEAETLTARMASTQLSLDNARECLAILSDFFKKSNRAEDDVTARFSILFAYAYGRLGDFNQSLAWFSRTHRLAIRSALPPGSLTTEAALGEAAEAGARMLLHSVPIDSLESVGSKWTSDIFVSQLLGEEQRLRAQSGYAPRQWDSKRPFWDNNFNEGGTVAEGAANGTQYASTSTIGVILPLTGPYASLGLATKNGIELAIEKSGLEVKASFLDDSGDALQASVRARELMSGGVSNSIIIGPIITAAAERVAEVARETSASVLALSKGAGFQTGDGVFRLGPTSASQVQSLLEVCLNRYQVSAFALVYPDDPNGQDLADVFRRAVQALGLQLVGEYQYSKSDLQAFARIASEIERSGAQAVFLPDNLTSAGRFFSALSPGFRQSIKAIGPANWYNHTELQQSRMALEGLVFVSPFFAESSKPAIINLVSDYETRYQAKPDFMAAQGFDAATIALEAIKRQHAQHISFAEALRSVELYEGLTGNIRVDSNGELTRAFTVVSFEQGQLLQVGE